MTRHRLIHVGLFLSLIAMFVAGQMLDGPSDHHTEWAISSDLAQAQRQAASELRRDLAAAEICRTRHGEASFTWTHDGSLVCIPRGAGRFVSHSTAQGARP